MLVRTFEDRTLAQNSYLIGCQECGEAVVIDPARDITPYLEAAEAEGMRITHVTETHIHADFVSGARELAAAADAALYLSGEGGPDWLYGYADEWTTLLHDGDSFHVGQVRIDVLHMPGHTPEHLVFQVTDTAGANAPYALFTGDCLFVGDMGRPDLLETAVGVVGSKETGARGQFQAMQRLKAMPDYLLVFPGHGAGSACGKALGALPSTTLGYEKRFNPAFQFDDESAFVRWLLADQPETPAYFAQMKRVNRDGAALLADVTAPQPLSPDRLPELLASGALVVDARPLAAYAAGHTAGTVNIPQGTKFNTYLGELYDYAQPYYLIAEPTALPALLKMAYAIGADRVGGTFTPSSLVLTETLDLVPVERVAERTTDILLLDVRARSEYDEHHIAGAELLPLPRLAAEMRALPHGMPIMVYCASGMRSQIAASYLRSHGYTDVVPMEGGLDAWEKAALPVEQGEKVG